MAETTKKAEDRGQDEVDAKFKEELDKGYVGERTDEHEDDTQYHAPGAGGPPAQNLGKDAPNPKK